PHFKFPSPIEHAFTPKVRKVRRAEIGFRTNDSGQERDFPHESLMLTGDQNIVDIDLVVQWRIQKAEDFLFNVRRREKAVRDVAETTLRGIIGQKKIDEVLTIGRSEIQILLKEKMQDLLNQYHSGIEVTLAQLKEAHPPAQVVSSFKDVVSAREDKERMINEAQGYRNAVIPEARGKAAQVILKAEAYREEVTKRSQGDVSRFLKQFEEYKKAPEITRKRIYLETMEEIYPKVQKFVLSQKGGGVLPILPLTKTVEETMKGTRQR
ncbi:MAG: FtsH protease activity modulator HflK, partial [Nitrospinaceae bacterium]